MLKTSLDLPVETKQRIDKIKGNHSFGYMIRVLLLKALDLPIYQDRFSIQHMEIQAQKLALDIEMMRLEVGKREEELQGMLTTLENIKNTPVPENHNPHNQTDEEFQESLHAYLAKAPKNSL